MLHELQTVEEPHLLQSFEAYLEHELHQKTRYVPHILQLLSYCT